MPIHTLPSSLSRLSLTKIFLLTLTLLLSTSASAAKVKTKIGNLYFINNAGQSKQLTTHGIDSHPILSPDKTKIAFVRTLPKRDSYQATADNEIWIIDTTGATEYRLVATHIENDNNEKNHAQFNSLAFSLDGKQLYFLSDAWVTSDGLHVVNLADKEIKYITDSNSVRVIAKGKYTGCLIVQRRTYNTGPEGGAHEAYWLFTAQGVEVKMIGKTETELARFIHSQLAPSGIK